MVRLGRSHAAEARVFVPPVQHRQHEQREQRRSDETTDDNDRQRALDFDAIAASVKKTARLLVAHEDKVHGGFGGEVVAQVGSQLFPWLDAPVKRIFLSRFASSHAAETGRTRTARDRVTAVRMVLVQLMACSPCDGIAASAGPLESV